MAVIVRLAEHANRETVAILKELVDLARDDQMSIALCFRSRNVERCVFTGAYKVNPALGVNAAIRMTQRLTQMQRDLR